MSVSTNSIVGSTYKRSGHVHGRLILAICQRGAISTCVRMAIYHHYFVVNLVSPQRSSLQRLSPFSRRNSARLKGVHSFLAPRRSHPFRFWTCVTNYLFLVIKSMTTRVTTQGASGAFSKIKTCNPKQLESRFRTNSSLINL